MVEVWASKDGRGRKQGYGFSYFVLSLEMDLTYHLKEDDVAMFYWLV